MAVLPLLAAVFLASAHAVESLSATDAGCGPRPLLHSHNDYLRPAPLFDALRLGYDSVEADVFFVNGHLLVGHSRDHLDPKRTLESLYLSPLERLAKRNKGMIRPGKPRFVLLIELKSKAASTYPALRMVLERHRRMLTTYRDGRPTPGAVTVLLTGYLPWGIQNERVRLVALDGGTVCLGHDFRARFMPWINLGWTSLPRGDLASRLAALEGYVRRSHAEGKKVRVWGAPDDVPTWHLLRQAGVDILQSDNLPALKYFAQSCR